MRVHRKLLMIAASAFFASLSLFANLAYATQGHVALPVEDVQRFTTALSQIKNFYVEPVDDKKLFEDAIRGMLVGLDPHSDYLDEDEFADLRASTSGEFSGLGIEVTMEKGYIKVISPIDGTPAFRAGIESGDLIVRLDELPVKGMTLRDAVKKMRGKKGSSIVLTIIRQSEKKPLKIKVTRGDIQVKSVKTEMLPGNYGYTRISHFQAHSSKDLVKGLKTLQKKANNKMKGLIIDLRNNPGGLLDSAIEISDLFLDSNKLQKNKRIVYTEGRLPGSRFEADATRGDVLKGLPIVVLVNEGSASGSEIVAGALQDHSRALVVGTKTFGKGSVQTVLPLDDLRGVKMTTALYYTPAGRSIQATGIEPDITVAPLEIPEKKDEEAWIYERLSEADLKGHISHNKANGKAESKQISADKQKDTRALIYRDYQLHQALNLLRGIDAMEHIGKARVVTSARQ